MSKDFKGSVKEIIELSENNTTRFVVISATLFFVSFVLALIAVALSGVLLNNSSTGTICDSCNGIVENITTDNGTTVLIDNTINIKGKSGIITALENMNKDVIINNLRDLTPYTVSPDGESEYLTPQEAYNAAVADGRGGLGLPAVIIMSPGTYSFYDTQFEVTTPGISFVSFASAPGSSGAVVFTANSSTGGIHVDIPLDLNKGVIFQGITFGAIGDTIGFLLNQTRGQCSLYMCAAQDSNFRIVSGGAPMGEFTIIGSFASSFNTLPPNDFVTTTDPSTVVFFENTHWTQLGVGAPVSNGGYIFNFYNGIGEARFVASFSVHNAYDGFMKGPAPGVGQGSLSFDRSKVIINEGVNLMSCFIRLSGPFGMGIIGSDFSLQGPLIYQTENSSVGDRHVLYLFNSPVTSHNSTILYDPSVNIVGIVEYNIFNSVAYTQNEPLLINIPFATAPDNIVITLSSDTIRTNGPPNSDYAIGPDPSLATIYVGTSTSINGANTATGFTYVPLTTL